MCKENFSPQLARRADRARDPAWFRRRNPLRTRENVNMRFELALVRNLS